MFVVMDSTTISDTADAENDEGDIDPAAVEDPVVIVVVDDEEYGHASRLTSVTDQDTSTTERVNPEADETETTTTPATNIPKEKEKPNKGSLGEPMSLRFQQITKDLVQQVDFFRIHTNLKDFNHLHYTKMPDLVDWGSASSINKAFPSIKGRGKLIVPMALLYESDQVDGKLVIINYWRMLKANEQRTVRDAIRTYYLRPSQDNERINLNVGTRTVAQDVTATKTMEPPKTQIRAITPDGIDGILVDDNEGITKAIKDLSTRVQFFREVAPLDGMTKLHFTTVPSNIDWNDSVSVNEAFPPLTHAPPRDVPICMLLEAISNEELLVVVNWWRYLDSIQQPRAFQELRRYYRAPTKSKDYMRDLQDVHDKRKERQVAPTWGFRCIETCQQLADKLKVTCDMIQTANLESDTVCKTEECVYPAMCGNSGFCCRHRVSFAPRAGKERRKRGHYLLGPAYTKPNHRLCSCNNDICVGIGFSDAMVRFDVTRLPEDLQTEIWNGVMPPSRKAACLAPWHFHPQHRLFQPDGSWILTQYRRSTIFNDPVSGKEWLGIPPPTYSLKGEG
jgi:hypothetical protein